MIASNISILVCNFGSKEINAVVHSIFSRLGYANNSVWPLCIGAISFIKSDQRSKVNL